MVHIIRIHWIACDASNQYNVRGSFGALQTFRAFSGYGLKPLLRKWHKPKYMISILTVACYRGCGTLSLFHTLSHSCSLDMCVVVELRIITKMEKLLAYIMLHNVGTVYFTWACTHPNNYWNFYLSCGCFYVPIAYIYGETGKNYLWNSSAFMSFSQAACFDSISFSLSLFYTRLNPLYIYEIASSSFTCHRRISYLLLLCNMLLGCSNWIYINTSPRKLKNCVSKSSFWEIEIERERERRYGEKDNSR